MVSDTSVDNTVVNNKEEEVVKTDKELIAEEEKTDQPEKCEQENEKTDKEDVSTEKPVKKKTVPPKKTTLHYVDWEENKVYLYQSPRTPQLPSIHPDELKIESWLKLHGIKYENVDHKSKLSSRNGTLPFVELNGEEHSGFSLTEVLENKFEVNMSDHLGLDQKNIEHALVKMVENHIYWAIMNWRTSNPDNTIKAYKIHLPTFLGSKLPVGILNFKFNMSVCKKIQKKVKVHGVQNIEQRSKDDLSVLSTMLAEKEFMFGEEMSTLDIVLFSHLAQILMVDEQYPCHLRDHVQEHHTNLVGLVNRVKDRCWGDHWEQATGEHMESNPHIPKPEPSEPVKEDKDNEEKKADTPETKEEVDEDNRGPEEKDQSEEKKEN